jgi:hypothetical protein
MGIAVYLGIAILVPGWTTRKGDLLVGDAWLPTYTACVRYA